MAAPAIAFEANHINHTNDFPVTLSPHTLLSYPLIPLPSSLSSHKKIIPQLPNNQEYKGASSGNSLGDNSGNFLGCGGALYTLGGRWCTSPLFSESRVRRADLRLSIY